MRLKSLELDLKCSEDLPIQGLRSFILDNLKEYGEPLRWAITSSSIQKRKLISYRHLIIEAVVIYS